MRFPLVLPLLFLGLALPAAGQGEGPKITAALSTGVVKLGERTSIVISVEHTSSSAAQGSTVGALPEVDGLELGPPTGPRTTSFSQRVGRRVESSVVERWDIPVRPLRAGEFDIPGLEVAAGGAVGTTQPLRLKAVVDMTGADLGFIEVRPSAARVVEGQPFTLEVRFGWDATLGGVNFADLTLGFDGIPGAVEVEAGFPPAGAATVRGITVNGAEVVAERLPPADVQGRSFVQMRLARSFMPTRGGRIEISESFLNFGEAERRGGFLQTYLAKIKDYYVGAPRLYVEVVPLPDRGQPVDYTGAVGALEARASVDRRDVDAGESIKLSVEWTGAGNLEFFEAPDIGRLDAFRGFRVYGRTEEKSFEKRTTVYDLAPVDAAVESIPPVPLRVYEPEQGGYVTVETPAIPIRVRALPGAHDLEAEAEPAEAAPGRDLRDIDATPLRGAAGAEAHGPSRGLVLAALLGLPVAGLFLRTAVRRRGDPAAPLERRRRRARRKLARALEQARGPADELRALEAFLAERAREPDEAWVGRDVAGAFAARPINGGTLRARANGNALPPEDVEHLRELVARLERAAWSQDGGRVERGEVLAAADRLLRRGF